VRISVLSFSEYKGIEVSGQTVYGLMQAFGQFKSIASKYLLEEGIGQKAPDGLAVVERTAWYPLDAQLRAIARFSSEMGDSVVHQIGVSMIQSIEWLPAIHDVKTLAEFLDLGYHVNHRRHGKLMGDPATGSITEGIGHYFYKGHAGGRTEIEATNPYPCAFDKGLLFGALRKLHVVGAILHDETLPCRKRGHKSCVYVIKG
jgi:hypothetical protein